MLYNMFKRIGIRLASLKVDEILSMGAKETPNVEIQCNSMLKDKWEHIDLGETVPAINHNIGYALKTE